MGNDNNKGHAITYSFFNHPDAKELFGKVDYALRDGVHIQNRNRQTLLFQFIQENSPSLKEYYSYFFDVSLENSGEGSEKYYYIDFSPHTRGSIDVDHRYFMPNEHVIIGFLLYKIIYIDSHFELNSVKRLQKMIRQDYEDLKPGIFHVLAKIRKVKVNQMDDDKIDRIVETAMSEFNKIGWIELDDDTFDTMPAFHRLHKIYGDYINNIDDWFKQDQN